MKEKLPKILLTTLGILVLGNILALDYLIFPKKNIAPSVSELPIVENEIATESGQEEAMPSNCLKDCQQLIDQKINEALAKIPSQRPVNLVVPTTATGQQKVSYIPLIAETTINSADWTDISPSDFYFNLTDYGGAKSVRFEVYLKSLHQAGRVYVRLYDITNKRAVDYSDLSSLTETYELQRSSDLTIWRGNNLYRLQGKVLSGIEGYLKDAKLKIIVQ